ncbi:MAG: YlbE family protein [Anaerolineaceae bacterium]
MTDKSLNALFDQKVHVLNIGLESMAESLEQQQVAVERLNWQPPQHIVPNLMWTKDGISVDEANAAACERIITSSAVLVGMGIAKDVIPGMRSDMILHAGPPITWERMCGPTRGAVMGALIYEGLAKNETEAEKIAASGDFTFEPCHHHQMVGPMAGIVSPSMPVFILENAVYGVRAFATQNEGLGKVLRYGAMGEEVYARLRWMQDVLYPTLARALETLPQGIDIKSLIAQALHMGDECHNRNRAGTSLFLRAITPALVRTSKDAEDTARVIEFINSNDHFFLNLSMAAGKATLLSAEGIPGSTILTTMARNGTDFGIRLASMPQEWFTAPAGKVQGLYLPGFSEKDANPDIGDSTVTETAGFGGFAMAAAPAITQFVGGSPDMALNTTLEMYEITHTQHRDFTIPALGFRGTPLGIDVRKVLESGILPQINTGIAHRLPGIGMVGAGVLRAPQSCFEDAFNAFRKNFCDEKEKNT